MITRYHWSLLLLPMLWHLDVADGEVYDKNKNNNNKQQLLRHHDERTGHNIRNNKLQQAAADLLAQAGVTGLCHPWRSDLLGSFPLCGGDHHREDGIPATSSGAFPHRTIRRNLGDKRNGLWRRSLEEERDKDNDNYYDFADDDEEYEYMEPPKTTGFYVYNVLGAFFCIVSGALVAGIMIGLLSLDPLLLLIKARASECPREREQAEAILPVVKQHHLLLVTLLLLNTLASEALPVYLGNLVPDAVAVILSVLLVLFCGEILPTAYFTGRNQVRLAAQWVGFTKFLLCATYPIAYPIAKLLDFLVGGGDDEQGEHVDGGVFRRSELAALIRIQYEERLAAKRRRHKAGGGDGMAAQQLHELRIQLDRQSSSFHHDEVAVVEGAMQMKTRCAVDLLKSYRKVFSVSYDTMLDEAAIVRIFSSGYSRIPVYEGKNKMRIRGILMSRQLILVNKNDPRPLSSLPLHIPQCVGPETNLVELVNLFQTGGTVRRVGHMALVCARPDIGNAALEEDKPLPDEAGLMGIITLEDVLEAILSAQILDEMDAAGRINMIESEDDLDGSHCVYHLHCSPINMSYK